MMKLAAPMIALILLFSLTAGRGQSYVKKDNVKTKVFFTQRDVKGKASYIKGRVQSFSVSMKKDPDSLIDKVEEKTAVTVRLYNNEAVHVGDTLYVIDEKNLVTAKMQVTNVFKSASFGYMAVGYGNFRLSSVNDRVVQLKEDSYSKKGFVYRSRGDYYVNMGDLGKAIVEYKKALSHDKGNPEVHLELGYVYYRQGLLQFASKEFSQGYAKINRIYDKWDKYRLLKGLVTVKYKEIYESYLPQQQKSKHLAEGMKYAGEALKIHPDSLDMHFYLAVFNAYNPEPSDEQARDHFLKVIELNPDHSKAVKANIFLARLYLKHKNADKARIFASQALQAEPYNAAARDIVKKIDDFEKKGFIK